MILFPLFQIDEYQAGKVRLHVLCFTCDIYANRGL